MNDRNSTKHLLKKAVSREYSVTMYYHETHHLQNLKQRDGETKRVGEAESIRTKGVVGVHDGMDDKVHAREGTAVFKSMSPA